MPRLSAKPHDLVSHNRIDLAAGSILGPISWGGFFLVAFFVLMMPSSASAYIGPGAGFAVLGSFFAVLAAMASAFLIFLTWPVRFIVRARRRRKAHRRSRVRRLVILGLVGMDPELTDRFLAEGKLPNFARLRDMGCYKRLGTTLPPLSPVAWSSFTTGSNPGKHNIYDFLTRDKKSYRPLLSSVQIRGPRRTWRIGPWVIPLGKPDIRLLRKGKPFWTILGEHGIFSNILRVPITFPPERHAGVSLSAMCVPDLRGSQGTFSYYTTRPASEDEHTGGERFHLNLLAGGAIRAVLIGPENPYRPNQAAMTCPFEVRLIGRADEALLTIGGKKLSLQSGVYSEWIKVRFKAGPGVSVHGVCQFLLLRTEPHVDLYVTPVQIDPGCPAMPISHPQVYSAYLSKRVGTYATLGLAEDTWGLNERVLDDEAFWEQCVQADTEREGMFFDALDKVRQGLVVCVFDGTDRVQHMFWRYIDPRHPACRGQGGRERRDAIETHYSRLNELVGKTMDRCERDGSVLFVISDHGFKAFRYGVDLNRWLEEQGYLTLREGGRGKKYLAGVDWTKTRAYAIGLAGIYLNVRGREAEGVVEPAAAEALRREIAERLTGLQDTERGITAIRRVYEAVSAYRGPYKEEAPDLIVGYNEGYRVSWDAAVGRVTDRVIHPNTKAWSGDHCIDPTLVPGVLFCNRKITTEDPRLIDLGPTALDLFGVEPPKHMDGRALEVAV